MTDENNAAQAVDLANRAREWAMQRGSVENFPATARAHIRGLADALLSKLRAEGVQAGDERESFSDWAWKKDGLAIGHMDGQAAAWEAWQERARRAALASAPVAGEQPIKLSDDVLNFLKEGVENATQCEEADVDQEFADQLLLLMHTPLYTEPRPKQREVDWGPLVAAPVVGEAQKWQNAQRIVELLAVDKALANFCDDGTQNNAVLLVLAILDAAPQASEAVRDAALEEAAKRIEGGSFLHEDSPVARFVRDIAKAVRALKHHQADKDGAVCSCPSGDGSLRWPCAVHPPTAAAAAANPPEQQRGRTWSDS